MWKSKDIMDHFKVTRMTVNNWRELGMPCENIGKKSFRYKKEEVILWVNAYRSKHFTPEEFEKVVRETAEIMVEERMKEFKANFLVETVKIIDKYRR